MGRVKYALVAVLLIASLVLAAIPGCTLFDFDFGCKSPAESPGPVSFQEGSGEPLVEFIPKDFSPVVEEVAPAVVRIEVEVVSYWWRRPIVEKGVGAGVIISSDGYILTNRHVVEGAKLENIKVYLMGQESPVTPTHGWTAKDTEDTDLAMLKIEGNFEGRFARFAPEEIRRGQWVLAFGYPYGMEGEATVSEGIISAMGRTIQLEDGTIIEDVIQTTAAINPGNSGGPLVDLSGNIVGINTAIIGGAENIGFAIGIEAVRSFIEGVPS